MRSVSATVLMMQPADKFLLGKLLDWHEMKVPVEWCNEQGERTIVASIL